MTSKLVCLLLLAVAQPIVAPRPGRYSWAKPYVPPAEETTAPQPSNLSPFGGAFSQNNMSPQSSYNSYNSYSSPPSSYNPSSSYPSSASKPSSSFDPSVFSNAPVEMITTPEGLTYASVKLPASALAGMTEEQKNAAYNAALSGSGHKPQPAAAKGAFVPPDMFTDGKYDPDKAAMHYLEMKEEDMPKTPTVQIAKNVRTSTRTVDEPDPTYMPGQDALNPKKQPAMPRGLH